jgi:hypothetical protein
MCQIGNILLSFALFRCSGLQHPFLHGGVERSPGFSQLRRDRRAVQNEVVTLVGSTRSSIVECEADKFGCR